MRGSPPALTLAGAHRVTPHAGINPALITPDAPESTPNPNRRSKMESFYVVTFAKKTDPTTEMVSRISATLRGARSWKKWLISLSYVSTVRIMKGGQGGIEVQ